MKFAQCVVSLLRSIRKKQAAKGSTGPRVFFVISVFNKDIADKQQRKEND